MFREGRKRDRELSAQAYLESLLVRVVLSLSFLSNSPHISMDLMGRNILRKQTSTASPSSQTPKKQ
jgi:hypothetical protein